MTYRFADRLDRLGVRKKQLDKRWINLTDGTHQVAIQATVSEPAGFDYNPEILTTTVRVRHYIVDVDDLILNDQNVLPKQGWKIIDIDGTFECQPEQSGAFDNKQEPVFIYTTQSRKRIRIKTKQVKAQSAC